MFQVFKTKYHSKKLNAKDNSHSTPTIWKSERYDRNLNFEKKEKQWVIYYSDTGDMGAYFPQIFLIISQEINWLRFTQ